MNTSWDWVWWRGDYRFDLTIDLWSFMFGVCIGCSDVVIHFAMATLIIEDLGQI